MIISHKHRFIFVAIPKTGTHSVRKALRKHLGPDDHEQVQLHHKSVLPYPALAARGHGHISLRLLEPHLERDQFDGYLKFAFVRNPFDRFVSYCSFMRREDGAFERDPKGVMRSVLENPPARHILFAPQAFFVTNDAGAVIANEMGRVEDMQRSYDRICKRIGIPSKSLERANSSKREDYKRYYDDALREGVARLYPRDLELFGYKF